MQSFLANHLIMNASFIPDLGLYHGKMGIVIFFMHYAKYKKDILFEEFAGELLDEIYDNINNDISLDFESGLSGIGWGINYLLKSGYMEGDADEILCEIDSKISDSNFLLINNNSIRKGLTGIYYYWCSRLTTSGNKSKKNITGTLKLIEQTTLLSDKGKRSDQQIIFDIIKNAPSYQKLDISTLGLENGCAGVGLKKIII